MQHSEPHSTVSQGEPAARHGSPVELLAAATTATLAPATLDTYAEDAIGDQPAPFGIVELDSKPAPPAPLESLQAVTCTLAIPRSDPIRPATV